MTNLHLQRRRNRLPENPSIEHLKNQAKDVLNAHKARGEYCCAVLGLLDKFCEKPNEDILSTTVTLQEAQHALARSYDFPSWSTVVETVAASEVQSVNGSADPFLKFVENMLAQAITSGASQLYFEPYEFNYRVRLRIDGIVHTVATPAVELGPKISELLKSKTSPKIVTKGMTVTGRFPVSISRTRTIEFKIDIIPTVFGEKINLLILDASSVSLGFDLLGLNTDQSSLIREALADQRGLILDTCYWSPGKW